MKLKRYNESDGLDVKDLIYLFTDMSDEYRNIAIQTGEYFRSKPMLLSDLLKDNNHNKLELDQVMHYLEQKKKFVISIQIDKNDKLADSIKVLNFLNDNRDQINYYGYKLSNFFINKDDVVEVIYSVEP